MNNPKIKKETYQSEKEKKKEIKYNTGKLNKIPPILTQISNIKLKNTDEQKKEVLKRSNNNNIEYLTLLIEKLYDNYNGLFKLFQDKLGLINENIESLLGQKRKREYDKLMYTPKKKSKFEEKDIDINSDYPKELYSPNINSDNESIVSDTYNVNFNLRKNINSNNGKIKSIEKFFMDYFNKDYSNSIFYGTPKKSKIEIVSPCIIKYEKMVIGKKQFIIVGKEKIKFNENFKIQFIVNKFDNHFYVGFINLDLALKSNSVYKFHNWKSEASILFSTRKTIWNYLNKTTNKKGGIKIKCNDVKTTYPITFSYNLKEKSLKIELRDFQTIICLNSIINSKNDFRFIIFFEGPGTIIQIKKY